MNGDLRFAFLCLPIMHMPTPAVTTVSASSACPECGIIRKSGKMSCCSRGGSWFGKCESAGNAKLKHTWYEGIWACDGRQSRTAVDQQLNAFLPKSSASVDDTNKGVDMGPKVVVVAAYTVTFTPPNTSVQIQNTKPNNVSVNVSIITSAWKSRPHDAVASSYKTITMAITTIIYTAVYIS